MEFKSYKVASVITGLVLANISISANALTPEDFEKWFQANQNAQKNFKDGDVITMDNANLIRAFVPPGYQDEMIFDGMNVVVKDPTDLSPPSVYLEATREFKGQATLGSGGEIENYVAGRPFDPETFVPGDGVSGTKAAWNFNYRWQGQGLRSDHVKWIWVREGEAKGSHSVVGAEYEKYYSGGGQFTRALWGPFQRVYLSHRADLKDQDYKVNVSWSKDTEYRELTGFSSPFDIAGTAFLIKRSENPKKADNSWAYIPSLRRVRRISVEVKSDSLLGTDHTLEDFFCFAGRPLDWDWEYMGVARVLSVARSRNSETHYYGPNGWVPEDDWELRKVNVYKGIPKNKAHPYSVKYMTSDYQNGTSNYCNAFDKKGELWKVWQLSRTWTEDPQFGGINTPEGTRMSAFQSINVIDKQNGRGTLVPTYKASYPNDKTSFIRRKLDVNQLTQGQ